MSDLTHNEFIINAPAITLPKLSTPDTHVVSAFAEITVSKINRGVVHLNRAYATHWWSTKPKISEITEIHTQAYVLIEVLAGLDVITTKEWTALHAELRYAVNQCKERRLLEATRVAHLKATA